MHVRARLRARDIIGLQLDSWQHQQRILLLPQDGGEEIRIFPDQPTAQAIEEWIELRGEQSGALFNRLCRGGAVQGAGLSQQAIYNIVKKHRDQVVKNAAWERFRG